MRKKLILGAVPVVLAALIGVGTASANHAGETATLSKSEGVTDGETVTVTFANLLKPGETTAQIIMANTWPVKGPDAFNLAEFGAIPPFPVKADGSGTVDFVANIDHDTYNCLKIQCYVVVFQGVGLDSFTAGAPIKFADATATTAKVATTEAVVPVASEAVPATEPAPVATEPIVIAPAPTEPVATTPPTTIAPAKKDDSSSSAGPIIAIVAAAVLAAGAGGYFMSKKKKQAAARD